MAKDKKNNKLLLYSYLPKTILNWYVANPDFKFHRVSVYEGILCFIDVSGFTKLSSKFSKQGKEGVELLTETLNTFFASLDKTINNHNGDILKFSGDAVWVYFKNDTNIINFFDDCLKGLEHLNKKLISRKLETLKIHGGAEQGEFKLISLGDKARLEMEIFGSLVQAVDKAADLASDNQLLIGERLKKLLELDIVLKKTKLIPPKINNNFKKYSLVDNKIIQKYIPSDVLSRIYSGEKFDSITSEYREVISLFINFEFNSKLNTQKQIDMLQQNLSHLFAIINKYQGNIARIDPYGASHKLLVLFGTPVKREFDEFNAIKCATEITSLKFKSTILKVGITKGQLFCGDVGAATRREFTVMGESINLAARLMAKAKPNQIMFDVGLKNSLPPEIKFEEIKLSLKGIASGTTYYLYKNISEQIDCNDIKDFEVIGQVEYLRRINKFCSDTSKPDKNIINIYGARGAGKTTLLENYISQDNLNKYDFISCSNSLLFQKGWVAKKILQKLIDANETESLKAVINDNIESKWLPLFSFLTGNDLNETKWTKGLDQQTRKEKTIQLVVNLINKLITKPFLLILDDCDKADEFSREFINALVAAEETVQLKLILVTAKQFENINVSNLEIEYPKKDEWTRWFDNNFEKNKLESDFIKKLLNISNGNPQFVTQFINYCSENNWLIKNRLTGKYEISDSSFEIIIPDDLNNLHLIEFDTYPEYERRVLKIAAVLNVEFNSDMICSITNGIAKENVITVLDYFVKQNILKKNNITSKFEFVSSALRDAIYSCIPQSELKKNHAKFARYLENSSSSPSKQLLAYHYYFSGNYKKGFYHCFEVAIEAADDYLLNESAIFFERCRKILIKHGNNNFTNSTLLKFFIKFVEFKVTTGNQNEASKILRQWRNLSKKYISKRSYINSLISTSLLLWKQSKYKRCEKLLKGCLKLLSGKKYYALKAQSFYLLAEVKRRQSEFEQALKIAGRAVKYAKISKSKMIIANAYNNQGLAHWGQGNLGKAADSYQKCLEIGQGIDDLNLKAKTANNLAIIKWELGEFISAQNLMEEALMIYYEIGDKRKEAYASGNLANLYKIFGKIDMAEEMFHRSDLIFDKLNDRHAHNYTIGNLGDIEIVRGDLVIARELFTKAFEFGREVDDKELMTESEIRFGDVQFFNNKFKAAESHYNKAFQSASKISSSEFQLRSLIGLARVQIGLKNYDQAISAINKLKELSEENNVIITNFEADFLLAEYYRIKLQNEKAIHLLKQVFKYASEQELFELMLKCLARLYELDTVNTDKYISEFKEMQNKFVSENRKTDWMTLIDSSYFSHFSQALQSVFPKKQLADCN